MKTEGEEGGGEDRIVSDSKQSRPVLSKGLNRKDVLCVTPSV